VEFHPFAKNRMQETQRSGMKGMPVVTRGFAIKSGGPPDFPEGPVVFVSDDRMSDMGAVNPNLMVASRVESALHQRPIGFSLLHDNFGLRGPRIAGTRGGGHEHTVPARALSNGKRDCTVLKTRYSFQQRLIGL